MQNGISLKATSGLGAVKITEGALVQKQDVLIRCYLRSALNKQADFLLETTISQMLIEQKRQSSTPQSGYKITRLFSYLQDDELKYTVENTVPKSKNLMEMTIQLVESWNIQGSNDLDPLMQAINKTGALLESSPSTISFFTPSSLHFPAGDILSDAIYTPSPGGAPACPTTLFLSSLEDTFSPKPSRPRAAFTGLASYLLFLTEGRFCWQKKGGVSPILEAKQREVSEGVGTGHTNSPGKETNCTEIFLQWARIGFTGSWKDAWTLIYPSLCAAVRECLDHSPHLLLASAGLFLYFEIVTQYILSQVYLVQRADRYRRDMEMFDVFGENTLPVWDLDTILRFEDLEWREEYPNLLHTAQENAFSSRFDPARLLNSLVKYSRKKEESTLQTRVQTLFNNIDRAAGKDKPKPSQICMGFIKGQNYRELVAFVAKGQEGLGYLEQILRDLESLVKEKPTI